MSRAPASTTFKAVKRGETIRMFVLNSGPSIWSAFHVIGTVFDKTNIEGPRWTAAAGRASSSAGSAFSIIGNSTRSARFSYGATNRPPPHAADPLTGPPAHP